MSESNNDLIQRLRYLLMGQSPMEPTMAGAGGGAEEKNTNFSTGLLSIPFEDGPQRSEFNMLNTRLGYADPASQLNAGVGVNAIERSGPSGSTGYIPQVSAGYGPLNLNAGYSTITPNFAGAKNQNSFQYGGSLNIPLDEEARKNQAGGATANVGVMADSGRMGTMLNAGMQMPFLGGLLGVDVSTDPSLRRKEIMAAYRRQF